MTVSDIFSAIGLDDSGSRTLAIVIIFFMLGLASVPYLNLPSRVKALEESSNAVEFRLLQQEQKLDLVVCFLETEANGGNPLACSR